MLFLTFAGLLVCILAALRDGYPASVIAATTPGAALGMFPVDSPQSTINSILGGVIFLGGLAALLIRKETFPRTIFWGISAIFLFKFIFIEVSRLF